MNFLHLCSIYIKNENQALGNYREGKEKKKNEPTHIGSLTSLPRSSSLRRLISCIDTSLLYAMLRKCESSASTSDRSSSGVDARNTASIAAFSCTSFLNAVARSIIVEKQ